MTFLEWLDESGLMVHYRHIDLMYWSIVDIVDSILVSISELQWGHMHFKADLYEVVKSDRDSFVEIIGRYQYPDIHPDYSVSFIKEIIEFIENHKSRIENFNY